MVEMRERVMQEVLVEVEAVVFRVLVELVDQEQQIKAEMVEMEVLIIVIMLLEVAEVVLIQ